MQNVLLRQRVRCILEVLDERRATGEPWPPSVERIRAIIGELDAEIAAERMALEAA